MKALLIIALTLSITTCFGQVSENPKIEIFNKDKKVQSEELNKYSFWIAEQDSTKETLKLDSLGYPVSPKTIVGVGLIIKRGLTKYTIPFPTAVDEAIDSDLKISIIEKSALGLYYKSRIKVQILNHSVTYYIRSEKLLGFTRTPKRLFKQVDSSKSYRILRKAKIKDIENYYIEQDNDFSEAPHREERRFYIDIPKILCNEGSGYGSDYYLYSFSTFNCNDSISGTICIYNVFGLKQDFRSVDSDGIIDSVYHNSVKCYYGKDTNGNYWKYYFKDEFVVGYYYVQPYNIELFDQAILSFRYKKELVATKKNEITLLQQSITK